MILVGSSKMLVGRLFACVRFDAKNLVFSPKNYKSRRPAWPEPLANHYSPESTYYTFRCVEAARWRSIARVILLLSAHPVDRVA